MVDDAAPGPVVVVVVDEAGAGEVEVVAVTPPVDAVVLVVVPAVVVVVVDEPEVVDVLVVGVVVDVVVVGDAGGGFTRFLTVVPVSAPPKMAVRGLPEISSTAVMHNSASTNTTAAVAAMARQEKPVAASVRRAVDGDGDGDGLMCACRRSVAGAAATAEISRRSVSPTGAAVDAISTVSVPAPPDRTTSVGADVLPLAPVAPSLRSKVADSGALTTTCLTASWPRSMDCATKAVAIVAAAEPMATPTMVPLTPNTDAMIAAITAPAVEARICRNENFTGGVSTRPCAALRRGR